jgi:6-phosphogluconolactonase (cycloisomerase 2 family)
VLHVIWVGVLMLCAAEVALGQLTENCTVSVLNRTERVNPDGSWVLPNIPANFGQVKARATCVHDGLTISGESDFFAVPVSGAVNLPTLRLGSSTQIPISLSITPGNPSLTALGQMRQLLVTATYPDSSTKDVSAASTGTNYTTSNPAIATVGPNGLVTAVASGTVVIQATNDGATGIITANVTLSGVDSDGDGIPDDAEIRLGLDPHNPVDAQEDFDRDNLTNLQEYLLGTDIRNADTDGDGLSDGDEVNTYHTNPLLADTDGDLIPDGVEVQTGSNPLDRNSYDLRRATASSILKPSSFVLTTSVLFPVASQQLNWKVNLIDGKTTLDLTEDPRTNYSSSDLTVCNFGAKKGQVFAGNPGNCVITISNNTLSVTVPGTVQSFTPTALSFVDVPGFANNVDVSGNFAYVAAGSAGLQVVDVSDHSHPHVVASRSLPGNANDVVIAGNYAYVAAGTAGLQIVNISDPLSPTVSGSLNTGGVAWDVVIKGTKVYVANGANGLVIVDVSTPSSPMRLGSLSLPGTSKGVDVDVIRQIAAVGLGTNGLAVVNVANPAAPALLATLPGGDVRDLAIAGNFVFLADFSRSFTSVDLTNPSQPVLRASTAQSLGGLLQDVVVNGSIAAGADVFFVNGVPMIDVSTPANPQPRLILDFRNFRDDNGTGIAMDQSFVYLTAESGSISENGVNGTTRLYIGQYRNIQDTAGIPPTVQITSPANGTQVIQGSTLTVTANATDDVAVASVSFFVNGQLAFTTTTAPYQYTFTAPSTGSTLILGATALDFGNNVGQAPNVTLNLIPDPLTTVTGRVVDETLAPLIGATVSVLDRTSITGAGGAFSVPNVPTIEGSLVVNATFTQPNGTVLVGMSVPTAPVRGGTTNVGDIVVRLMRDFVYTNNNVGGTNTVSAFSVASNGVLTQIVGSPFLTGGSGSGSGLFASNRITTSMVGNFLFVSNGGSNNISVFSINPATGSLTAVAGSPFPTGGAAGNGISLGVTPDNKFLFAANAGSGNITVYSIAANGALAPIPGSPFPAGGQPDGIKVSPDGAFLSVALFSNDAVAMLSIASNGTLTPVPGSPFPATANGTVAGLDINCASNLLFGGEAGFGGTNVDVFSIASNGALTSVPGSPFNNPGVGSNSNVVLLSPDDRLLFVSNQESNTFTVFNVAANGSLSLVPGSPFAGGGGHPSGIATNAAGTFLYAANFDTRSVSVLLIGSNGTLTPVPGSPFGTGQPSGLLSVAAFPAKSCAIR